MGAGLLALNWLVIVTTDHGRGRRDPKESEDWREHSWMIRGSEETWAHVRGPKVLNKGFLKPIRTFLQTDIRPMIEKVLEL